MKRNWLGLLLIPIIFWLSTGVVTAQSATSQNIINLQVEATTTPPAPPVVPPNQGAPLPTPLIISNVTVLQLSYTEATLAWLTNMPATTELQYGQTTAYELGRLKLNDLVTTQHQLTISNLQANTFYHVQIIARTANNQQAVSNDYLFLTASLPDTVAPANVVNIQVTAGDGQLTLSWQNPPDNDLAGVQIVRRDDRWPRNPQDGVVISRDLVNSIIDKNLINDQRYFYALFSYDRSNNLAAGALAAGVPLAGPGQPQVKPGPPPAILPPYPPVKPAEKLNQQAMQLVTNDNLILAPDANDQITVLNNYPFKVVLPFFQITKQVEQVIVEVQADQQQLFLAAPIVGQGAYTTTLALPLEPGIYPLRLHVFYKDKTQDILSRMIKVVPRGLVVDSLTNQPLSNTVVILWQRQADQWQLWSDTGAMVNNPQMTDANGSFGFMVPNGYYRVEVLRGGYRPWQQAIAVNNNVVALLVKLSPETIPIISIISWPAGQWLNLVLAALIILVGWLIRRQLRRG